MPCLFMDEDGWNIDRNSIARQGGRSSMIPNEAPAPAILVHRGGFECLPQESQCMSLVAWHSCKGDMATMLMELISGLYGMC